MKEKKREREEEGVQGERKREKKKKKGKKKKYYVGFKPVRVFLLVSCLCNGRGWLEGLVSLFSLPGSHSFAVVQPADSPITAAPLCWVFCLCPRELVGPAGCASVR